MAGSYPNLRLHTRLCSVLIERYRDDAALDAHVNSPHYQEIVVGRVRPLLTDRRVEVLRPREAG